MKVKTLERRVEREFCKLGRQLAQPIHKEIADLITKLQSKFPITGLDMGNRTYFLRGDNFPVVFSDDSDGDLPMEQLFDALERTKVWRPRALNNTTERQLRQLEELLDYLTDAPYLPLFSK